MINKSNLEKTLIALGYIQHGKTYEKKYDLFECAIKVDTEKEEISYPEDKGFKVNERQTLNFSDNENFVVLECVTRLLDKGYRPEHIELEKRWSLGHEQKGGRADICVYDTSGKTLFIVECKTYGKKYDEEYKNTQVDGGQVFSYWQQERSAKWLLLYASTLDNDTVIYKTDSIDCTDDSNILVSAKKDSTIKLYKDAHTAEELFEIWDETYEKRFCGDVVFRDDTSAYQIGIKPLRKKDLKDFSENDKVVNRFEEILRHNNVSDKENAFNRLVALFICKLVDEIQKSDEDEVEFQYKVGTDTYESLQDRLQRLHKDGMEKFMREEIFYVSDNYAEDLVQQYTGQKRQKMVDDLKHTLRILKFYTNNDFAFKDVHNEELFYQNGKILVEVVQLFEKYRIIGSSDVQMLGDLFEQLLNKGFKQNEGQFFTPIPIARFIWDSLPIDSVIQGEDVIELPKVIDYACGAGHFLTEGFESISSSVSRNNPSYKLNSSWAENKIYGVEKDYRLARVSKISLFMHGAGDGNIIFGDGLENYKDKNIVPETFDILVANPPYSVAAFKPHLKLKDNDFSILDKISNSGSEIETLFVERISQLVKPRGIAAVILPSSILNKENESFIAARESLLKNFYIKAIAQFGSKTFGATGTNTVIMFLEKYAEPPKRIDLVSDSVQAIFESRDLSDWEDKDILDGYLDKIGLTDSDYSKFVTRSKNYKDWEDNPYFSAYLDAFLSSTEVSNKKKQKSFEKASAKDKTEWYNKHFYEYASGIESDKLTYFALCYRQKVLIIAAPDDNKEQEKFLGYKWSNRKGQEGIQIIKPGGLLYDESNRTNPDTLAGLVRESFSRKQKNITQLSDYYYYLHLQDMIDFSVVDFNKSIKTTKTREVKIDPDMKVYKLGSKEFDISIGNRVLSTEITPEGSIPVYSANVYEEFGRIDKHNLTDFSKPSIIWGIDGDWMVNVIPAGKEFYPTDHCGVLRLNTNDILPEYLAVALEVEGGYERFSRNNRASTQRVRNLSLQIPKKTVQKKIVDEISAIDKKISKENIVIRQIAENVKAKFVDMFEAGSFIVNGKTSKYPLKSIEALCSDGRGRVINNEYIMSHSGDYPVYSSQTSNEGIMGRIDTYDFDGEYLTWTTDGAKAGTVFYRNGKFSCTNVCGTLKALTDTDINMRYLAVALGSVTHMYVNHVGNNKLMNTPMKKIKVPVPPKTLQDEFARYVENSEKQKIEALARKDKLLKERNNIIEKHFK